jgi:hypothetical protein
MFEHVDQYIPAKSAFYKALMKYDSFLDRYVEQYSLPKIKNIIGQGSMGYVFDTTDPKIVFKITGFKPPPDSYEFRLFNYARQRPHPALCSVKAALTVGKFYMMWKCKLQHTATTNEEYPHLLALHKYYGADLDELIEGAKLLYEFGYLIKFKTNYFQREIDQLPRQDKVYLRKHAYEMATQLKSVSCFTHIAELLVCFLDDNLLIQDLTSSNLGINIVEGKPYLCILDGMLLDFNLLNN